MDDRWRSVQEISEYLGVSTDSVYRWVEKRGLPVHRVGRLFRFKCSEVDEWVRRHGGEDSGQKGGDSDARCQKMQPRNRASAKR